MLALVLSVVTGPSAAASRVPAVPHAGPALAGQTDRIADAALKQEFDPQKIFRFVADKIRYEPYAGILRGALGTLEAGAGNSVDKALLLAALLDRSGVAYRFVRGPLDQATTTKVVESMATDVASARKMAEEPLVRGLNEIAGAGTPAAAASGSPDALYEQQAQSIEADGGKRLELAKSRLGDTVTMLSDALDGAGIESVRGEPCVPAPDRDCRPYLGADGERSDLGES